MTKQSKTTETLRLIKEGQRFLDSLETPSADDSQHWIPLLEWIESAWRECFSSPPTKAKVTLARLCGILESIAHQLPDDVTKLARCRSIGKNNGPSDDEKREQFAEWDQRIRYETSRGKKKTLAMRQLRIPKSTYYEYGKLAAKKRSR